MSATKRIVTSTYKLLDSFSERHRYTGLAKNFVQGKTLNEFFGQHNTSFDSASRSEIHMTLKSSENLGFLFSHMISFSNLKQVVAIICLHLGYNVKNCMRILYSFLNGAANVSVHVFEMLF